jgi:ABC-type polysaccharide/polyol phosphate export permease
LLLVWFYATPIVYPAAVLPPRASMLLRLNPIYWFMELLRASLWTGGEPVPGAAIVAPLIALATFSCGWFVFTRLERRFYLYL